MASKMAASKGFHVVSPVGLAEKAVFPCLYTVALLIKYTSQAFRTSIISILQWYHVGIISFHVFSRRLSKLETEANKFCEYPKFTYAVHISGIYQSTIFLNYVSGT